ncbi:MAG: STAS-like domain-containing protein [Prevotellaceae bacterium]|jgi:hypothetical protein|nr:STAS-like domain-containing protein [Prevotellaceae bacterium]
MQRIVINQLVTMKQAVTPDEGELVYNEILPFLQRGETVALDFSGIELMTTAFLNVAIGSLYKNYSSETLSRLLQLDNLSQGDAIRVKRVTDTAKSFYANTQSFEHSVENAIYGKD